MEIRRFEQSDMSQTLDLINKLHPKWFDKNALVNIPKDIQLSRCCVALENNQLIGFISFYSQDGEGRIGWLGVDPEKHNQGIGKQLINAVESGLKELGIKTVRVETVVEQSPEDGTYDLTMKFYRAVGFKIENKYPQEKFEQFTFCKGVLIKHL